MADPQYRIDSEFLTRGVHFILSRATLTIECSWCDEPEGIFHCGRPYEASLNGTWIGKAAEHLINEHPDKIGVDLL